MTTTLCFLILVRSLLLGSRWNEVSLEALAFLCRLKFWFGKKIEDEPAYCPDRNELLQISRPCKNYHCFQKVVQLFNIIQDYLPIRDSKRLECVKKCFSKQKFYRIIKILDFFEHALIPTKCLVPCMFELTDVYYINLISIILPSHCLLFKIFLRSSICLTKLLPTMTSIWLNYINSFWLFRNCIKTCFCMRKHIDISRTIINFLML